MSAPETETPRHSGSRSFVLWPGLSLLGLLLLYVLSVPPVVRFNGGKLSPALETFYKPLIFAYEHSDAVQKFYDWYFKLWGMRP